MSFRPCTVAAVQMRSTPDLAANLTLAAELTAAAAGDGAEVVLLPEAFAWLGPEADKPAVLEPLPGGGPILDACRAMARANRVQLVLGGFHEQAPLRDPADPDSWRCRNTCVHLDANGHIQALYRKIHLFDVAIDGGPTLTESRRTEPGDELVTTELPCGPLGLSICYDLRFPALYQALVARGAMALTVPSAFTRATGQHHWRALLRARAIECQAWVVAPAQWGHHFGPRESFGHALVADPWGNVVAECASGDGYALASLDPELVQRVRSELPSLANQRPWRT